MRAALAKQLAELDGVPTNEQSPSEESRLGSEDTRMDETL